ncbi:transcription factor-like protein [Leptomonas pyrrhocoris]|uniref:FACT complex subunit n=1 Tax=Leptomonas pyrrhocoris TaxID=157538 RepID=A0A0M9G1H3_LEPPY|nr:transcription factor-like protein [Leptomonas pyrrhocoris]KPA80256.1 transcription factor-like protein [Leptomonas pyrrhocoris]|eukprot:XP_015658695.1 transcription factor-like protein [Leptomonas pyrrhocoris]
MSSAARYTVSASRLATVLQQWQSAADAGEATAAQCGGWACVFGERSVNTPENQRGQAMVQYLLEAKEPVTNAAAIITKEVTLFIHADGVDIAPPATKAEHHAVEVVSGVEAAKPRIAALLSGKVIGAPLNEFAIQEGAFAAAFVEAVKSTLPSDAILSAAPVLGELLFVKDEAALSCVEKAAGLCCAVFRRYARDHIASEMSERSPKKLYDVRQMLYAKLEHPNTIQGLERLDTEEFSLVTGLPPCIFHKGTYKSQLNVDEDTLKASCNAPTHGDVVVVRYGLKNAGYTAFLGRTLLVASSAPPNAKEAYQFAYDVSAKLMEALVPGAKVNDVYATVVQYATELNATLAAKLSKTLGFSTGLLVLEARGTISPKGTATVADGMSFVTRVVLEGVASDGAEDTFDVELTDTVVVHNGVAELKTKVARKVEEILYEDLEDTAGDEDAAASAQAQRNLSKITRQGQSETVILSREAQREQQLRQLLSELHEEFLAAGGKKGSQTSTEEYRTCDVGRLAFGELNPYKPDDRLPPQEGKNGIVVQTDKKVVWLPVCGRPVSFHISTINKVDVKAEGDKYTMTVTFHSMQESNVGYKMNRTKVFVKELTYSSTRDVFTDAQIAIQGVQQRIKNEDAARKRALTSASSGRLTLAPNPLRLPTVKIRPPITSSSRQNKGCVGNLELHANGLRFSFLGGVPVDMLFDNIKHVIFQPAVKSIYVIYHVTLKKPIEINRKSVTEIQFVAEVMESSELASGVRRSYEEELQAEERDEERIKQTNKQFITFAYAVEERSKIRTQLPTSQFAFDGVHARSMTTFKASREVLWAITDIPAFTQSAEDIEVVSFERVIPGGATFDMSFILKDYNKPVVTISSIPRNSLENIKDWCLSARLYYMETTVNPNWRVTMKDIREDPDWDPWLRGEGWSVLNNETNDEEDEEGGDADSDSDSDSTYYEDEDEDEESSDSDDSSWLEDEESDVDADSDASDDSSDADWDELERKAAAKDRAHRYSDDDEDRPRKRARTAAAHSSSSAPPAAPASRPTKMPINMGPRGTGVPPARRF